MTPKALVAYGTDRFDSRLVARDRNTDRLLASHVSLAVTRALRRKGLLGRENLGRGEALWISPCRGVHTCGMRFAIDVIALDGAGRVIDRVDAMPAWRLRLPRRGTAGVLELPAGTLAAAGTELGHTISFEFDGAPAI